MKPVVLDASAILAFVFREPGSQRVLASLSRSVASTVNWAEVAQSLRQRDADVDKARSILSEAGLVLIPLSPADAERAAFLRESTRALGLGLADRCCLALAADTGRVALTADIAWASVDAGAEVELIR